MDSFIWRIKYPQENNSKGHGLYCSEYTTCRETDEFSVDISSISPDYLQIEQLFHSFSHIFNSPLLHKYPTLLKFREGYKPVSPDEGHHF